MRESQSSEGCASSRFSTNLTPVAGVIHGAELTDLRLRPDCGRDAEGPQVADCTNDRVESSVDRRCALGWALMRTIRVGGVIRRPVEDAFRVLSNPANAPKWSPHAIEEKLTSPPPVQVGSTRRAVVKTFGRGTAENHAVCTAFEPNRRIAWQTTSAPIPFQVTVDFVPVEIRRSTRFGGGRRTARPA